MSRHPPIAAGPLARDAAARLWQRLADPEVQDLAAGLAFRFFLALFPFFIFVAALGGVAARLLRTPSPVDQMLALLGDIPIQLVDVVRRELETILGSDQPGFLSLGAGATLVIAANGMSAFIRAMDRAYRVPETRPGWERGLLAVGLTLLAGVTLVVGFLLVVVGEAAASHLGGWLGWRWTHATVVGAAHLLRWLVLPLMLTLAMAFLYHAAPNLPLRWKWALPGAALFTTGWLLTTWLLSVWATAFGAYGATYGTLGGGAMLLIWLYGAALLLQLGAELNAFLDERLHPVWIRAHRVVQLRRRRERRRARVLRRLGVLGTVVPRWWRTRAEAPGAPPSVGPRAAAGGR